MDPAGRMEAGHISDVFIKSSMCYRDEAHRTLKRPEIHKEWNGAQDLVSFTQILSTCEPKVVINAANYASTNRK